MIARNFDDAEIVQSVSEEYEIVRNTPCECGGSFLVKMQSLHEHNSKMYDVLHCKCTQCGLQKDFIFDINSFFGKMFE